MVSLRWAWAPEPASWLEGAPFLKMPRWADASAPSPFYPWDWLPAHPKAAMMIIKPLQPTAAAMSVLRSSLSLSAAAAAELHRSAAHLVEHVSTASQLTCVTRPAPGRRL